MEGVVDGVTEHEICGWIRQPGKPGKLAELSIVSETGAVIKWKPAHYRPDVCKAFGENGIYGFHVPKSLLKKFGNKFKFSCGDGSEIQCPEIDISEYPNNFSEDLEDSCKIYLHIQKSGGTSVVSLIHHSILKSEFLSIYPGHGLSVEQFVSLPLLQRRFLKLVTGHTYFGIDKYIGKKAVYAVTMRHPLQRLKSQMAHVLHNIGPIYRLGGQDVPLHEVVTHGLTEEFDNLEVRMIAGLAGAEVPIGSVSLDDARLAMSNLAQHFGCVNVLEQSQGHAELLHYLNLDARELPKLNTADSTVMEDYKAELEKVDWAEAERRHLPAIALYNFVLRNAA